MVLVVKVKLKKPEKHTAAHSRTAMQKHVQKARETNETRRRRRKSSLPDKRRNRAHEIRQ